jgi:hypothetical protein
MSLVDTPSLFGRLVGAHHVEEACVALLDEWMNTYLAQVERISGEPVQSIQRPRSYRVSSEQESMPEDQTPAVVVRSPGTLELPLADGSGRYGVPFEVEVGLIISAIGLSAYGSPRALRLARIYALAIRGVLVQQADDDGLLYKRDWLSEAYDTLASIDDRTICLSRVRFSIAIPDVVQRGAGPLEADPDPQPPAPQWPLAETADVEVQKYPIEAESFDDETTSVESRRGYRRTDG